MEDEIKEILDNIRKIIKSNREDDFNRIIYDCDSVEKLLDYITNLQEENERLKVNCNLGNENLTFYRNGYKDYKSRCEKADNWIDKHIETYTKGNITIIDWDTFADPRQLKNILQGVGKDE